MLKAGQIDSESLTEDELTRGFGRLPTPRATADRLLSPDLSAGVSRRTLRVDGLPPRIWIRRVDDGRTKARAPPRACL
jgi:hypothetical protein